MFGSSSSSPVDAAAQAPRIHQADQPLELAVHSLPMGQPHGAIADAQDSLANPQARRWGRIKMALVLLVCAAPVLASYFTYYVVRPEARRNFGELIDPQRPLPSVQGWALDGAPVPLPALRQQWLLIMVAGGDCDAQCEQHLYLQRQLREALGKDKDRLERVWLVSDQTPVRAELLPALQGATVLRVSPQVLTAWLAAQPGQSLADHLYMVDPIGNWMLRWPADVQISDASRVRRDIERLLRASRFWDEAGRPDGLQAQVAPAVTGAAGRR
jgi:hypothetical protein